MVRQRRERNGQKASYEVEKIQARFFVKSDESIWVEMDGRQMEGFELVHIRSRHREENANSREDSVLYFMYIGMENSVFILVNIILVEQVDLLSVHMRPYLSMEEAQNKTAIVGTGG